jgi:hypothetical protein
LASQKVSEDLILIEPAGQAIVMTKLMLQAAIILDYQKLSEDQILFEPTGQAIAMTKLMLLAIFKENKTKTNGLDKIGDGGS